MSDRDRPDEPDPSLSEPLPGKRKSPLAGDRKREVGMADTLPHGTSAVPMPPEMRRGGTFPPTSWDEQEDVISSTRPPARSKLGRHPAHPPEGGVVESHPGGLAEDEARRILDARFAAAGMELRADYSFKEADLVVTLDGYDPERTVGYAYLSHADADVVTDFDEAAELAFQQLSADGVAHVLIVHDTDAPDAGALERRIDGFLAALERSSQPTETF